MEKAARGSGRLAGGRAGQRGLVCRLLIRASSANAAWLGNCHEPVSRSDFCTGPTLSSGDGSTINRVRPHLSSGCPSHREELCALKKASEKTGGWGGGGGSVESLLNLLQLLKHQSCELLISSYAKGSVSFLDATRGLQGSPGR